MRSLVASATLCLVLAAGPAFAASPSTDTPTRQAAPTSKGTTATDTITVKCPENYVCIPIAEMATRTAAVWELKAELSRLKARSKRLGWVAGCGAGVAGVVDEDWQTRTSPAAFCGAMYGFRW